MKTIFIFLKTFFCSIICLLCFSCGSIQISNTDFTEGSVQGELIHTQYYNKFDEWILDGLYVLLIFKDGQEIEVDINDEQIEYDISPAEPTDGVAYITLKNINFIDVHGTKHNIPEVNRNVRVVPFPFPFEKPDPLNTADYVFIGCGSIALAIMCVVFFLLVKRYKNY